MSRSDFNELHYNIDDVIDSINKAIADASNKEASDVANITNTIADVRNAHAADISNLYSAIDDINSEMDVVVHFDDPTSLLSFNTLYGATLDATNGTYNKNGASVVMSGTDLPNSTITTTVGTIISNAGETQVTTSTSSIDTLIQHNPASAEDHLHAYSEKKTLSGLDLTVADVANDIINVAILKVQPGDAETALYKAGSFGWAGLEIYEDNDVILRRAGYYEESNASGQSDLTIEPLNIDLYSSWSNSYSSTMCKLDMNASLAETADEIPSTEVKLETSAKSSYAMLDLALNQSDDEDVAQSSQVQLLAANANKASIITISEDTANVMTQNIIIDATNTQEYASLSISNMSVVMEDVSFITIDAVNSEESTAINISNMAINISSADSISASTASTYLATETLDVYSDDTYFDAGNLTIDASNVALTVSHSLDIKAEEYQSAALNITNMPITAKSNGTTSIEAEALEFEATNGWISVDTEHVSAIMYKNSTNLNLQDSIDSYNCVSYGEGIYCDMESSRSYKSTNIRMLSENSVNKSAEMLTGISEGKSTVSVILKDDWYDEPNTEVALVDDCINITTTDINLSATTAKLNNNSILSKKIVSTIPTEVNDNTMLLKPIETETIGVLNVDTDIEFLGKDDWTAQSTSASVVDGERVDAPTNFIDTGNFINIPFGTATEASGGRLGAFAIKIKKLCSLTMDLKTICPSSSGLSAIAIGIIDVAKDINDQNGERILTCGWNRGQTTTATLERIFYPGEVIIVRIIGFHSGAYVKFTSDKSGQKEVIIPQSDGSTYEGYVAVDGKYELLGNNTKELEQGISANAINIANLQSTTTADIQNITNSINKLTSDIANNYIAKTAIVTNIVNTATDDEIPSAKAVYTMYKQLVNILIDAGILTPNEE